MTVGTEMRLRRFWASIYILSFGPKPDFVSKDYAMALTKVPLPCSEERFGSNSSTAYSGGRNEAGVYAELVKALILWYMRTTIRSIFSDCILGMRPPKRPKRRTCKLMSCSGSHAKLKTGGLLSPSLSEHRLTCSHLPLSTHYR